ASKALALTLTSRGRGTPHEAPMCGVPYHAAQGYIGRLVRQGFRVAICDQVEDPRAAKGIVRRAVTRVLSPGTVTDDLQLPAPGLPRAEGALEGTLVHAAPAWAFARDAAYRALTERLGTASLEGFGCEGRDLAIGAAGGLLHHLRDTQKADLKHLTRVTWHEERDGLVLDAATRR